MANNDPLSGLFASMSKVKQRRPGGMADLASTADQAGTVQAQPATPAARPIPARSFRDVLPMPAQPAPAMPLESPESLVEESFPASGPQVVPAVAGTAYALMQASADLSYGDAYLLSLGYLFGIEPEVAEQQATPELMPVDGQAILQPAVAEMGSPGTVL